MTEQARNSKQPIYQFYNCTILWRHKLIKEDLWVRNGIIQDPRVLFFDECRTPDFKIDCKGLIIVPGFIDLQLNGGFSIDFSSNSSDVEKGVATVAKGLLAYGVTSFCPTIVTSPPDIYRKIIPKIKVRNGSSEGAGVLGIHLEGPFVSKKKKGAHPESYIIPLSKGFSTLEDTYSDLTSTAIITLAPELDGAMETVSELAKRGIVVSVGHSMCNLAQAEEAVNHGASFITHLFNAMLPFHHRDPGIVGLLASHKLPKNRKVYYGMIADGIHTHPAALRIAYRADPEGVVLVTDAIAAMGLPPGEYKLGQENVTIEGFRAHLTGTDTLAGSVATMPHCIKHFKKATACSLEEAVDAATLHPAQCMKIDNKKGTLEYGTDADFLLIDEDLNVIKTYIAGELVYSSDS